MSIDVSELMTDADLGAQSFTIRRPTTVLDPEGDAWALPDNDEALSFAEEYRAQQMRLAEDPWGDDEEEDA